MKKCSKCGVDKAFEFFYREKKGLYGLRSKCKDCMKDYSVSYDANNLDKRRGYAKAQYYKNLERNRERGRSRYSANGDSMRDYHRSYQRSNPEKVREHNNRRRARLEKNGVYAIRPRFLIHLYASSCVGCGSRDNITADHVIPLSRGGIHSEGNLQPLCSRCNSSKKDELWIVWKTKSPTP